MNDVREATGWQPIETAPKDGTDFLAFVPFRKTHHVMVGAFVPSGHFSSWPGRWDYKPTHWQPLPEPPTTQVQP